MPAALPQDQPEVRLHRLRQAPRHLPDYPAPGVRRRSPSGWRRRAPQRHDGGSRGAAEPTGAGTRRVGVERGPRSGSIRAYVDRLCGSQSGFGDGKPRRGAKRSMAAGPVHFAGSCRHRPLNGPCYLGRPGTIGPTPCRAREGLWTRQAARHD
jgi:hypothetical protein